MKSNELCDQFTALNNTMAISWDYPHETSDFFMFCGFARSISFVKAEGKEWCESKKKKLKGMPTDSSLSRFLFPCKRAKPNSNAFTCHMLFYL